MTEKLRCSICGNDLPEKRVVATKTGRLICPECFKEYLRRKKEK